MTVKLAAAISATRNIASVVTTSTTTAATTSSPTSPRADTIRPCAPGGRNEVTRSSSAFTSMVTDSDCANVDGASSTKSSFEIVRVLDDADDGPLDSIEVDRRADGGTDQVRDRLRHRRLGVVDRIPAAVQAEHRPPERSVRVLRSVVHRLLGARHRHLPVADRIDRSEPFGSCVELRSALPPDRCCRTGRSAWHHRTGRSPTPARRCRPPTRSRPTQPPTPSGGPRSADADASRGGTVATTT